MSQIQKRKTVFKELVRDAARVLVARMEDPEAPAKDLAVLAAGLAKIIEADGKGDMGRTKAKVMAADLLRTKRAAQDDPFQE